MTIENYQNPPACEATLRDYFAANATEEDIRDIMEHGIVTREQAKYGYADRMLEARAK